MSGLNNALPHYVFLHSLPSDLYRQWMEEGLDSEGYRFVVDRLGDIVTKCEKKDAEIVLDSVEEMDWYGLRSELKFVGMMEVSVAGEPVSMKVTGYISPRGRGVMWVEDGVMPLDDPSM